MALSGNDLATARLAAIAAVPLVQSSVPADALAYQQAIILADSTAIVDYFVANTVVTTTSGAPDGEHTGVIG